MSCKFTEFYTLIDRHFEAHHLSAPQLPRKPYAILVQMNEKGEIGKVAMLVPKLFAEK
jgi:hypothetical protein